MKKKVCGLFALAAGVVLAGTAIAYGEIIGVTIAAIGRTPNQEELLLGLLRTGLVLNLIPFVLFILFLIILSCFCICLKSSKRRKKYYDCDYDDDDDYDYDDDYDCDDD